MSPASRSSSAGSRSPRGGGSPRRRRNPSRELFSVDAVEPGIGRQLMELILWRHAEAEDAGRKADLARELTKRARKHAAKMAEWLKPRLEGDWRGGGSPAQRTLQTGEPPEAP